MNPNTAFRLSVEMVSRFQPDLEFCPPYWFQLVVETSYTLKDLLKACCDKYSWRTVDTASIKYWSVLDECFIPLSDDTVGGILFAQTATQRFGKIRFEVVRKPIQHELPKTKGKGAAANDQLPPLPRSQPSGSASQPSGSTSQHVGSASQLPPSVSTSQPTSGSGSQRARSTSQPTSGSGSQRTSGTSQPTSGSADAVNSDDEAVPEDSVPRNDDEDEKMFPEFAHELGHRSSVAQLVQDSPEEVEENADMLVLDEYDGDDMPALEWDRNCPILSPGTRFKNVDELRKACTMSSIISNNIFNIEKSQKNRYTVHWPDIRCQWKLHATLVPQKIRDKHDAKDMVEIRYNNYEHTCASKVAWHKAYLASKGWLTEVMTPMLRENQNLGATALGRLITDKYKFETELNYSKLWNAREQAMKNIQGPAWADSFQLLYTFKAEVEKASPGSVVEIDHVAVQSKGKVKGKGKMQERHIFRRAFVSFKACHQGFQNGCMPYLAMDATALTGRWKG